MPDYSPFHEDGPATFTAGGPIVGGQVVFLSAAGGVQSNGTVQATAGASTAVVGVAAHDAVVGMPVTVLEEGIQELTAAAAITAGATLKSAASGQVAPWVSGTDAADLVIGLALTAAASSATVRVKFYR